MHKYLGVKLTNANGSTAWTREIPLETQMVHVPTSFNCSVLFVAGIIAKTWTALFSKGSF